jgi:hypothetical protein
VIATPELDRMLVVKKKSQAIGEFIEWLGENGMWVGEWHEDVSGVMPSFGAPVGKSIEQLLADFYGIDLVKAEQERRAILAEIAKAGDTA